MIEYILVYLSCGFVLAMVSEARLGLPAYSGNLFLIAAMASFYGYWRLRQRRAQSEGVTDFGPFPAVTRWVPALVVIAVLCALISLLLEVFHR